MKIRELNFAHCCESQMFFHLEIYNLLLTCLLPIKAPYYANFGNIWWSVTHYLVYSTGLIGFRLVWLFHYSQEQNNCTWLLILVQTNIVLKKWIEYLLRGCWCSISIPWMVEFNVHDWSTITVKTIIKLKCHVYLKW